MLHKSRLDCAEVDLHASIDSKPPNRSHAVSERPPRHELAGASEEAVRFHYDAGTEFFRLWLDQLLVYSCARWSIPAQSLEQAQIAKIDFHLQAVGADKCRSILDVGCGWGALIHRATTRYGVERAVGITLSDDQFRHITSQNWSGVTVLKQSYEHLETQVEGIVSIGAFEHFVRPGCSLERKLEIYRRFFERCHSWLGARGRLSLQTICWGNVRRDRCSKLLPLDIFPESDLPYDWEIFQAANRYFELEYVENGREDYVSTLKHWLRRLRERKHVIIEQHGGAQTFEYYERYLRNAILGFERRRISLLRIVLTRL